MIVVLTEIHETLVEELRKVKTFSNSSFGAAKVNIPSRVDFTLVQALYSLVYIQNCSPFSHHFPFITPTKYSDSNIKYIKKFSIQNQ